MDPRIYYSFWCPPVNIERPIIPRGKSLEKRCTILFDFLNFHLTFWLFFYFYLTFWLFFDFFQTIILTFSWRKRPLPSGALNFPPKSFQIRPPPINFAPPIRPFKKLFDFFKTFFLLFHDFLTFSQNLWLFLTFWLNFWLFDFFFLTFFLTFYTFFDFPLSSPE